MLQIFILTLLPLFHQNADKRLLDIYTNAGANPAYSKQLAILAADDAGLKERDLVIVKHILSPQSKPLFVAKNIKGNFTIILTGKDGGEKYRGTKPQTLAELYGQIDAMPMRKDEMKKKQKTGLNLNPISALRLHHVI